MRAKRNDARMRMHENAIVKPVTSGANVERNKKSKSNWDDIQKGRLPGLLERSLTAQQVGSLLSALGAGGSLIRSERQLVHSLFHKKVHLKELQATCRASWCSAANCGVAFWRHLV